MDNQLLNMFSRSLFDLESFSALLDELLFPRQPAAGENAGKAVSVKGSKVPLSTSMLDLKMECESLMSRWCMMLSQNSDAGQPPADRSISARAAWLQSKLFLIDEMPWGEMCAESIIAESRLLRDVVVPPESRDDPDPIEEGSCREIARWTVVLGVPVHYSTVSRWAQAGLVSSRLADDGRVLVDLGEVMEYARRAALLDRATPHVV